MLDSSYRYRVYLASQHVDMRKSIDGLAVIVQQEFDLDPFSESLFVFCNKSRDKIKILKWDINGFWLFYKRLEKEKFKWPTDSNSDKILVSNRELNWLLDGLDINQKNAHKRISNNIII